MLGRIHEVVTDFQAQYAHLPIGAIHAKADPNGAVHLHVECPEEHRAEIELYEGADVRGDYEPRPGIAI